jgi:DNA polymerase III epsilon subunit-like protein
LTHPILDQVVFLDFEASSLDPDSWPVEVGLSWITQDLDVRTYDSLIRPAAHWPEHAWSEASAAIHNIPREEIDAAPPAAAVSDDLIAAIGDRICLSDNPGFEQRWLLRLFEAGQGGQVQIGDYDTVTLATLPESVLDHVYERLARMRVPHRAGADSARMARAWVSGLQMLTH